jgi:hypothetical protein
VGQYWRLPCERRRRQGTQLRQRFEFDIVNFTQDPGYLGIQISGENPERVRIVKRGWRLLAITFSMPVVLGGYEHGLRGNDQSGNDRDENRE